MKQFLEDVTAIEQEKRPDNHEVLLADMEMLEKLLAEVNLEAVVGEGRFDCISRISLMMIAFRIFSILM